MTATRRTHSSPTSRHTQKYRGHRSRSASSRQSAHTQNNSSSNSGSQSSSRKGRSSSRSSSYSRHTPTQRRYLEARPETRVDNYDTSLPLSVETSAGGLVLSGLAECVTPDGSIDFSRIYAALIGRLDRRGRLLWSMPKGHVEDDEAIDLTAEREVWEETGVHGKVFAPLGTIDYWFISDGKRIHKTVHHHLLRFVDGSLNDEDPEVSEVMWIPLSQLKKRLSYDDERKLALKAFEVLPDYARAEKSAGRVTPR